jgi:hypothetical protein
MFITNIDNYLDKIIDKFYEHNLKKEIFKNFSKDENFVKYQNGIISNVKSFIDNLNKKELNDIISNKDNVEYILNIIKRYCMFYTYLGIGYYYKNSRDLFITNIIETSKNQKDIEYQIVNFFNSENNAKIINFYTIIKNIIELTEFKTMERIKITLNNNPIKFSDTINFINELGEDYIEKYIFTKDNFHNVVKTFIFKIIYLNEEKVDISKILNEEDDKDAEYKYIDIVVAKDEKIIDFTVLKDFISTDEDIRGKTEDFYDFLLEYKESQRFNITSTKKIIEFLFENKILIPITEDFMRIHKNNYKYEKTEGNSRDDTKIKYIINIVNKVRNYHSKTYKTNPKLKVATKELFFKQLADRDAILYNALEENNIISKLRDTQTSDAEYVIDLENINKYIYLNYKDLSKDGFKLRTDNVVQGIRYSSIKTKSKLELRMGSSDNPVNVVGVIFNPSNRPLECFKNKDMRNIHDVNKNGYDAFMKILNEKFNSNQKNLYYWLFNSETDIVNIDEYKNLSNTDSSRYVQILLSEIYPTYLELLNKRIVKEINNNNPDLYTIKEIIRRYKNNINNTGLDINFSKSILNKVIDLFYEDLEIDIDEIDNRLLEEQNKTIKIPTSDKIKEGDGKIIIGEKETKIDLDEINIQPICHHYVKWTNLSKIPKKRADELNQEVFDFVKQYVRVNDIGLYVCKSCSETLNLKKYVYEGTYVPELDTFMTTNLATNQKLENIPKYSKYTRSIRNIEKNLEKICGILNINYYIGNTPVIKLRRRTVIKDVIDLILIHSKYLRTLPKDRIVKASENYGINKDLTNLFFFELKDDIFLTSADETDYYKIIKFNNIIAYLVFMIMADLNTGQILSFKEDKKCNFYLFSKVKEIMFKNLFFRVSKTEKIPVIKIEGFAYTLFYFSCMLTNSNVWLWDYSKKENNIYVVQKLFIHTMVDLINTLFEANFRDKKNYFYELIVNRFKQRLKSIYNDENLLKTIKKESSNKIKVKDGKITYVTRRDKIININEVKENDFILFEKDVCNVEVGVLDKFRKTERELLFDNLSNCEDGKFHKFSFNKDKNDIVCDLCGKAYSELKKSEKSKKVDKERVKLLKLIYLRSLGEKYCITGAIHDINENNKCTKCKLDMNDRKYTNNELFTLEKNLKENLNEEFQKSFNEIKKYKESKKNKEKVINDIIENLDKKYTKITQNKINNYISDFIDFLKGKVGNKVNIMNQDIYIDKNKYILETDLYGNKLKKNIELIGDSNIENKYDNHFKKNVIIIKDNVNRAVLYFDDITKIYLGYSKNDKYETIKTNTSLKIEYSIKDMLELLGLNNINYNINYTDYNYSKMSKDELNENKIKIINDIIRVRVFNLRQIINNINNVIDKVKFRKKDDSMNVLNILVKQFQQQIDKINLDSDDGSKKVFKHIGIINNNYFPERVDKSINVNINTHYLNISFLQNLNNLDSKLLFYLIFNLKRLLEYNANKTNIVNMIIKLIHFSFNHYYIPYENFQIRKFDSLILKDRPYIDESLRIVGFYQEMVDVNTIDEAQVNEMVLEAEEEMNSYDIDTDGIGMGDYDEDDNNLDYDADENVVQEIMD